MTTWTSEELTKIGTAEELLVASTSRRRHVSKCGNYLGRPHSATTRMSDP